ncbi:HNH endonuclease [Xanthobacter sp. DSM 24535]|uniref:HNH endonuclease n=1 Tax=Roseixanthobacter psychrophilus TaxID=3119917 RepID=UPI00372B9C48
MSADLIARLIEAGTPAHLVAEVAMALGRADAERSALEGRREADRERSRARREECPEKEWIRLRALVFARDGFACVYCGAQGGNLHCDHVMPFSRGGRSALQNLATACDTCNSAKRDRTPEEWGGPWA